MAGPGSCTPNAHAHAVLRCMRQPAAAVHPYTPRAHHVHTMCTLHHATPWAALDNDLASRLLRVCGTTGVPHRPRCLSVRAKKNKKLGSRSA